MVFRMKENKIVIDFRAPSQIFCFFIIVEVFLVMFIYKQIAEI